jgi:outer membrane protein assembly factor BamB
MPFVALTHARVIDGTGAAPKEDQTLIIRDGNIVALDSRSGTHLWHFSSGANNAASPMSYAVDGRQFVALASGNTVYAFALPESR